MNFSIWPTYIEIASEITYMPSSICQRLPEFNAPAFIGYREGAATLIDDVRQVLTDLGLTVPEPQWHCGPPSDAPNYPWRGQWTLAWTIRIPRPTTI